jgi:hypothetical protein
MAVAVILPKMSDHMESGAILDRYGMSVQDIIEAARRSIAGKRWNLR